MSRSGSDEEAKWSLELTVGKHLSRDQKASSHDIYIEEEWRMKNEEVGRKDRRGGVLYVSSELLESFGDLMSALVTFADLSVRNDEDKDWRQRSLMERAKEEGMSKQRKNETSKQWKIAERARKGRRDDRAKKRGRSKQATKEGTAKPVTKKEGRKKQTQL
jgi:hypothetical protein